MASQRFPKWCASRKKLLELLRRFELRQLLTEIAPLTDEEALPLLAGSGEGAASETRLIEDLKGLKTLAAELRDSEGFSFATETTTDSAMQTDVVGIAVATTGGDAVYVNIGHSGGNPLGIELPRKILGPILAIRRWYPSGFRSSSRCISTNRLGKCSVMKASTRFFCAGERFSQRSIERPKPRPRGPPGPPGPSNPPGRPPMPGRLNPLARPLRMRSCLNSD